MSHIRKWTIIQIILILVITCIAALIFRVNGEANYLLASQCLDKGDYQQAELLFSEYAIYLDSAEKAKQIQQYIQAKALFDAGDFDKARDIFFNLGEFEESADYLVKIDASRKDSEKEQRYNEACKYMLQENYPKACLMFKVLENYEDSATLTHTCEEKWRMRCASVLSAGVRSSAGISSDNTVAFTTGDAFFGKTDIQNWNNIMSVSVCGKIVIGLKCDGTVVTAKELDDDAYDNRINTDRWTDIVAVSAGEQYVVGLKSDGTVKAASLLQPDGYGETEVSDWENIIDIDTAWQLTVGLDQSGNVFLAGYHAEELLSEIEASKTAEDKSKQWVDIVAVSAGGSGDDFRGKGHVVGLTKDGHVVAVGDNDFGQCDVDEWMDEQIVAISAGDYHTVALTKDGRVLTTQKKECHVDNVDFTNSVDQIASWSDIVAVAAGYGFTLGVKSDGTVVAAGNKNEGQADVQDWDILLTLAEQKNSNNAWQSNN